ncbi:hypothetical protein DL770_006858 [Monosporascus sp. CRB-9-2]|nr:hypothetical protein DL770_006858 [Monosporascus sp. CRB-9-2]
MGLNYLSTPYEVAAYLGKNQDAARWRSRASTGSQAFLNILWDPAAGTFFDCNCVGNGCRAHAQDGDSLAILAEIANITYAKSALTYLSDSNALPYGNAFYDEGARFGIGYADSGLDQIHSTYGWMSTDDPGLTFWEGIGPGGSKYQEASTSLAYGWSTGVTPLLSTYVLSVKPLRPGFKEWIVKPMPEDVQWARGEVPTPYEPLKISWERSGADGDMEVHVHAPEGTNGTVSVPAAPDNAEERRALLDGIPGIAEMATRGYIDFRGEGGEEHVVGIPKPRKRREGCGSKAGVGGKIRVPGSGPEASMAIWK